MLTIIVRESNYKLMKHFHLLDKATDQNLVHQRMMRSFPLTLLLFCPLISIIEANKELKLRVSSSFTYIIIYCMSIYIMHQTLKVC